MTIRQCSDLVSGRAAISRRTCIAQAVIVSIGSPILAASAFVPTSAKASTDKVSKKLASYQDQPKGKEAMCSVCKYFMAPASCMVVEGTISPQGWCQRFDKRSTKT